MNKAIHTDNAPKALGPYSQAIEAGKDVAIGAGHGPVDHLFNPEKLIKS